MENEETTTETPVTEAQEQAPDEAQQENPLEAEVSKWKALSRKNETERNAVLKERDQLQEQITALNGQLETAQGEVSSARLEATRSAVARRYALSDDMLEFLSASDEDGLTAQAEKLSHLASPSKEKNSTFVIESEGQGATPLNSPEITDFIKQQLGY